MTNILRIDSSARTGDSVSRELTDRLIDRLRGDARNDGDGTGDVTVVNRDLAAGVPLLSESTLQAMWTPAEARTDEQTTQLRVADEFIDELIAADVVVIGLPIYNFGPPAPVKAWADLVARAGTTFRYTEQGPEGLLSSKPVYVVYTAGGVPAGSPMDHSSTWLTTFLGFIGLTDTTVVAADGLNVDPESALTAARQRVDDVDLATLAA